MLQHWRLSPPELFAFYILDAHHDTLLQHILHSLRSVAHEPDEEPDRLQGGGSHRREYDCHHASLDNSHTHIADVPGHHRHVAARHIIRLMLHCSPRFRICWSRVPSCHPVCTANAVKVLALIFRLFGDLMLMSLRPSFVSSWRGLYPLLDDAAGKSDTSHLRATANGLACGYFLLNDIKTNNIFVCLF